MSACHQNMSSTWGYAILVTEQVLAMRTRGGDCTKSWWGFLSALFSYMYLSACGLQNSSPESPLGLVWHCHYWTTYKCCGLQDWKQKEIVFLFLISGRHRDCAHIYWKRNDPWKMADPSIKSGNSKQMKKGLLIRLKPKRGFMIHLPATLHTLFLSSWFFCFFMIFFHILFFFTIWCSWKKAQAISLREW